MNEKFQLKPTVRPSSCPSSGSSGCFSSCSQEVTISSITPWLAAIASGTSSDVRVDTANSALKPTGSSAKATAADVGAAIAVSRALPTLIVACAMPGAFVAVWRHVAGIRRVTLAVAGAAKNIRIRGFRS